MPSLRKKVVGIIFDKQGNVLLGKYSPDYYHGNKLKTKSDRTLPGGGKEETEKYKDSILREIYEEVGILPKHLHIVYRYKNFYFKRYKSAQKQRFREERWGEFQWKKQKVFVLFFDGKQDIDLNITGELINYKRININQIKDYVDHKFVKFLRLNLLKKIIKEHLYSMNNW